MKRQIYKGFVIDTDNLGRIYIYNTKSQYNEESGRDFARFTTVADAKKRINERIADSSAIDALHTAWEQEAK